MNMEFKQLEAFVAVVENKSFSEAARQLNLTQPTISAHIQTLEQELNSRLLIRTTKKLTITQRGLQLYDCASNMLNMRKNIIDEFTGHNKKIIDLAVSTIPSSYLLPEILGAFTKQISDIYFHSWQSDSLGAVSRVLDGSVDLALIGNTFDEPDCCFIPFRQDKLVIATPVNDHYLQLEKKSKSGALEFSDFLKEPFIMRETGSGTKKEIDRYLEERNIPASSLRIVARMNDLEAIRKSVAGGLGISILSACSARDLADTHQILMFPLNSEKAVRTFYIVYSKNRILKPHVKQFLKFVKDFYQ
jgi:DNA-binding transcriptional LysR family regulator